ncbi:MAG TPA: MOSC domain-containing protein [Anaerolineales bacterium]|nr:MOSC domain-containing protein [Anaerolineales bacterium]
MKLISINIGKPRQQQRKDYVETTGIYKEPVNEPVEIKPLGIEADTICDTKNHGGPDQALYIYGGADYAWWSEQLGKELAPGTFGDNLTISDLESAQFNVGDYLHIGDSTLQVTSPRIPCGTFATRMKDPQWVKNFRDAERPGLYCRVIKEGVVKAGDAVSAEKYTGATISILEMYRDHYDKDLSEEKTQRYLAAPIDIRSRKDLEKRSEK